MSEDTGPDNFLSPNELHAIADGLGWHYVNRDGSEFPELIHPSGSGKFYATRKEHGTFGGWHYKGSNEVLYTSEEMRIALGLRLAYFGSINT